ncbi:MAG: type II toxin-antitoxin system VapC family toxin [Lachnospiraceae bacterium]|nr:type II toxin-antitoxin system VapC family toxin [Lachnospiraceae bacterium]
MNILLDTHILLWTLSNDPRLPEKARKLIEDDRNEIYYSIVSLWEVQIKHLAHPDAMPVSAETLKEYCEQSGFQKILVRDRHIFALADLKRKKDAPPHKDPFDRMLICQASVENMIFITHDSLIPGYDEPCIFGV